MGPVELCSIDQAREKRNRFLNDNTFPYLALIGKIREAMKAAMYLDSQKKPAEALAKLKEIEAVRPIEEIPMTELLALYSLLNGKLGNTEKQREVRTLLFGINQTIAHSGDGLSPETAVEVIAVSEEYAWLRDKGRTMSNQRVQDTPSGKFDVLTTKDMNGNERDYYFNITRMYPKSFQSLGQPTAKP